MFLPHITYVCLSISSLYLVTPNSLKLTNMNDVADQIFKLVPGGNTIFVGLSVFLGISAFGIVGAITGPLLAGIMGAILTIYKEYYFKSGGEGSGIEGVREGRRRTQSDIFMSPIFSPRGMDEPIPKRKLIF